MEISAENGNLLYVPPQYGHAFCTLADNTLLLYDVTHEYAPEMGVAAVGLTAIVLRCIKTIR